MKTFIAPSFAFVATLALAPIIYAQSPDQLAKLLKRFPLADPSQDGTLSVEEAIAYPGSGKNQS